MSEPESLLLIDGLDNEAMPNGHGAAAAGDVAAGDSAASDSRFAALELKVSEQQTEINSLKDKLVLVLSKVEGLEQAKSTSRSGPLKAMAPPRSAPAPRRQTMDPRQLSKNSMKDAADASTKKSALPASISKRFKSREKLPTIKDEPGTTRMYLKGRPVSFLLPEDYTAPPEGTAPAEPPAKQLALEWVYGYRGKDCRNNIYMLGSGEVLFFSAAVCVIQDLANGTQRHYLEHTDDVKCLALHPDKNTVASGQVAGHEKHSSRKDSKAKMAPNPDYMPHIRIWNSETLETLKVIGAGTFDRAVACISFSVVDQGQSLCAVDEHNDHRLSVWDWNKGDRGTKLAEMKASQDAVFQADFHPKEKNQIVCCGKNQLSFWTLDGKTLKKQVAVFEKHDKPKFITCFTFDEAGDVITGDNNGNMFVWPKGSNKISSVLTGAHDGVIFCVSMQEDGSLVSGGGKDRTIKIWDMSSKEVTSSTQLSEEQGAVRVVVKCGDDYIIGTNKNTILSGLQSQTVITKGHCGELWGMVEHPSTDGFVSCSYDNHVKMWDSAQHQQLWDIELPKSLHSLAHHPTADVIAIGSRTPDWYIYSTSNQEQITSGNCGSEQLECMEFSPDGTYLAIGSRDNHIYVYKVNLEEKSASLIGKCQGHTSYVTHVDWSTDSGCVKSNSGDYEVLFWDVSNCKQLTQSDKIRTLEWATQNCTLSLTTIGMWPVGADGTDINGCCKSHGGDLLASADDFGQVNLYTYPSIQPLAKGHHYSGHSSHVTTVRFLQNDAYMLSSGGQDSTVLQWKIV